MLLPLQGGRIYSHRTPTDVAPSPNHSHRGAAPETHGGGAHTHACAGGVTLDCATEAFGDVINIDTMVLKSSV